MRRSESQNAQTLQLRESRVTVLSPKNNRGLSRLPETYVNYKVLAANPQLCCKCQPENCSQLSARMSSFPAVFSRHRFVSAAAETALSSDHVINEGAARLEPREMLDLCFQRKERHGEIKPAQTLQRCSRCLLNAPEKLSSPSLSRRAPVQVRYSDFSKLRRRTRQWKLPEPSFSQPAHSCSSEEGLQRGPG